MSGMLARAVVLLLPETDPSAGLKPAPKVETVASRGRNRRTKGAGSGRKVLPKVPVPKSRITEDDDFE